MKNSDLKRRILDISKALKLSHIGSCLSVLPILEEIYAKRKANDIVLLDNAHAHLAHCLFLEGELPKEKIDKYGIHCDRQAGCDTQGGSLGHATGIGIGYALANRKRAIHIIVSDGSMQEGSNWEALRIASEYKLTNIHIYCNFNSFTAVRQIDVLDLADRMNAFNKDYILDICYFYTKNGEGFEGVEGHYKTI